MESSYLIFYSILAIGEEIVAAHYVVPSTFNLLFKVNFAKTRCHYEGNVPKPYLVTFLLLEDEHEDDHHRHYITLSDNT